MMPDDTAKAYIKSHWFEAPLSSKCSTLELLTFGTKLNRLGVGNATYHLGMVRL